MDENDVEGGKAFEIVFGIYFCPRLASLSCYKNMEINNKGRVWVRQM